MKNVALTEDTIPTIFNKLANAKSNRISSFMEKLNRKWVYVSDNRVILEANYWTFTSSPIREQVKFHLFAICLIYFLWLCIIDTSKLLKW